MKKLLAILALALCLIPAYAQKRNIVLGKTEGNGVSSQWVVKLRSSILTGLTATGRMEAVDGASLNGLSSDTGQALLQLAEAGGQFYLEAMLEDISTSTETLSSGKTNYKAKLEYSYKLYDVASGTILSNKKIPHYGSSTDGRDAAISDTFGLIDDDIIKMINNVFRVTAEIKAIDETHPKKGIVSVYLGAGSGDGVAAGNIFEIFKVMDVAGEKITTKIGEMKVSEVKSPTLSLCKVTKGGKELQEALDNEIPVQVTSRPPKDPLGGLNDVLNSL